MIELVFVIVVLGILSAVAIPRFAATRGDAQMTKGRSDIAAIRSGIALQRSKNMLESNPQANGFFPDNLDNIGAAGYGQDNQRLFNIADGNTANILEYPIFSINRDGGWLKTGANAYSFTVGGVPTAFTYVNGIFNCVRDAANCNDLTN